ncbi:MAG: peptidase M28, partial [Acidobacteriota bacterium]|nr:peptidase M28 [Acidobacteriota bacterium]
MSKRLLLFALLAGATIIAQSSQISQDKMRADVKYLASDELEGRGVGTKGERLATDYIAEQLRSAGVKPAGDDSTYFQRVPLVGSLASPDATLKVAGQGEAYSFAFSKDFVGTAFSQVAENDFDSEAVFVGHGISAPEFGWDDYKGVDLHGKVLVFFTNEPPSN